MGEGRPGSDVDMTLNSSAFVHLRNSVEALIAEGIYPPGDATTLALELWTAAHGVAALLIARPYLPWGDVEEFADRVMKAVCIGHIVSGAVAAAMRRRNRGDRNAEGNALMSSSTVDNPFFARTVDRDVTPRDRGDQAAAAREPGRPVRPGARGRRGHGDELRVLSRRR